MYSSGFIKMDEESFEKLSTFITQQYGIKLPPAKKSMLESRLNKKIRNLGYNGYKPFLAYIFGREGKVKELPHIVDLITTNKTDFFREPAHFDHLTQDFLPHYVSNNRHRPLRIWSAACSSGKEPYTILITLEEFRKATGPLAYSILASDINTRVLQSAYQGVYNHEQIDMLPDHLKRAYFLKSKDPGSSLVRIKPEYRKKIIYKRINLVHEYDMPYSMNFDVIFCRNVLIYFDKATQEKVINRLAKHLRPGGLLFLGHSESTMGMKVPFEQVKPTIYRHIP
ncbi:methyltransferase domain-containing protein [Fulvivirga sp. 29W222]|uniref:protein-glutamate O-methyltransferase n=1 Tax=Fulvivirga marina TaxID=2494733 RepID=A0A937G2Y5_9BACT|nr:CheR family methyltransferase [Fulvivirga marina]MBL6449286.1 methyltransferase domain-containing protein [Fulvivirga marina]